MKTKFPFASPISCARLFCSCGTSDCQEIVLEWLSTAMRSAKVFIVDYDKNLHRIKLRLRKADSRSLPDYTSPPENVLEVDTNGIDVHYFVQEITEWHNFRRFLIGFLCARDLSLVLRIIPPEKEPLDYIGYVLFVLGIDQSDISI